MEQSSLESRSRVCAKTLILTVILSKKTNRPIVVSLCRTLCAIKSMPASDCCAGAVNMLTLACYFCGFGSFPFRLWFAAVRFVRLGDEPPLLPRRSSVGLGDSCDSWAHISAPAGGSAGW